MAEPISITRAKSRVCLSLPLVVGLFAFATVLCLGTPILRDPDTYLHIAIGRWILAHHAVPHVGIFSETMPNAPWVADEWLAQAILALVYNILRWNGLVLATALSFAGALTILMRHLLRWLEPVHALIATIAAAGATLPHLLARPHILTLPIIALWFGALVEARDRDRGPPLWLLPLLTLWANLHGGYMFGLVFVGIFAGEALLLAKTNAARMAVTRHWGVFGLLAVAACVITPFGIYTLWLPFHVIQMKFALAALGEWQSPDFHHVQILEIWLLLALALVLGFGVRLPPTRIGMVLLLLHMSLSHKRDAEFLGFLTPLLLAPSVGAEFRRRLTPRISSSLDRVFAHLAGPANLLGMVTAVAVVLALSIVYLAFPVVRPADANTPAAALQAARHDHLPEGRVFNQYGFGDYLMFSGVAPFIDGRAELYGDAFFKRYQEAVWGWTDDLPKLLDEYHITWTIFAARGTAAVLMKHFPEWRCVYADHTAVVYARVRNAAKPN